MLSAPILFAWLLCLQHFLDAASAVCCVLRRMADFRGDLRTVVVSGGLVMQVMVCQNSLGHRQEESTAKK